MYLCHEPTFFCSTLVKSQLKCQHPGELKVETKELVHGF